MSYKQIDMAFFESFYDGNDDFKSKMISMFLEKAPVFMNEMNEHLNQQEWGDLGASAHKFKSCIDFVGAKGLRSVADQLEKKMKADEVEGAADLVANINNICKEVESELQNELLTIKSV